MVLVPDAERTQEHLQRLARRPRLMPLGVAVHIDEQLPVGELPGQPVRGVNGQGGLADTRHPVNGRDDDRARGTDRVERLPHQVAEKADLGLPADERPH
jgi:hypothetical protein